MDILSTLILENQSAVLLLPNDVASAQRSLSAETKIFIETDTETFFETKIIDTDIETFFETKFFETETETFLMRPKFSWLIPILSKKGKKS